MTGDNSMGYRDGDIDDQILRRGGLRILRNGNPLWPGGFTRPELEVDVVDRAAKHLRKPRRHKDVRAQLEQWYERVSFRHVIPRSASRERWLVEHGARFHNLGLKYRADARTRVIAHLWERPHYVAASWSAAAPMGITDFSHSADAWIISGGDARLTNDGLRPSRLKPRVSFEPWTYFEQELPLCVTPPMLTLAHCLKSTLSQQHSWGVAPIPEYDAVTVRAIQVIDRFRRACNLSLREVRTACHSLIDQRTIRKLARLSSSGMDSPAETSLRLALTPLVEDLGGELLPQLPVLKDGTVGESCADIPRNRLLTVIDLADIPRRVAIYYDGSDHLDRQHRDRDAHITAALIHMGWLLIRVSAGMLANIAELRSRVRKLYGSRSPRQR